jgi:hypothetical protein
MSLDIYLVKKVMMEKEIYHRNITYNLNVMWRKACVYDALYNSHGMQAKSIVPILKLGLEDMLKKPNVYKKLEPENGWGSYDGAITFLNSVIEACEDNPTAKLIIDK